MTHLITLVSAALGTLAYHYGKAYHARRTGKE